jgi:adenosylmethionine-8-amino-7-oxononanoate aminotransferase
MRMYPAPLLAELRRKVDEVGALLIADEVFTGFGRTGPMWGCEHAGVTPDLLCTAKGLSGGMLPFAATLATERVYDGFRGDKSRALMHGHTFCGNPLGAAVAREVLSIYRDDDVLASAAPKSAKVKTAIESMGEIPGVARPRALGMCAAFEVGVPGYMGKIGWEISDVALELGAHLRPLGNTVYIVPPLNIDDGDLDQLLQIVRASTERVLRSGQ